MLIKYVFIYGCYIDNLQLMISISYIHITGENALHDFLAIYISSC